MKQKNKNWILYTGFIGVILACFILWLNDGNIANSRVNFSTNFFYYFLWAAVFAPIIEEFAFRGFIFKQKQWRIISVIMLLIYTVLFFNPLICFFFIAYIVTLLLSSKEPKKNDFLILFSVLLFSVSHYSFEDFKSLFFTDSIFFQIGLGCILSWIFINFNYVKAVLCHSIYNGLVITYLFLTTAYDTDTSLRNTETDLYKVVWSKRVAIFESKSSSEWSDISFKTHNLNAVKTYKLLTLNENLPDNYYLKEPFITYDFDFKLKDTLNRNANSLSDAFLRFAIKEGVLAKR